MHSSSSKNILFIIIISLIILFFSFSYLFSSDKTFSENENRLLQVFPAFTVEKLLNGTYTHPSVETPITIKVNALYKGEVYVYREILQDQNEG